MDCLQFISIQTANLNFCPGEQYFILEDDWWGLLGGHLTLPEEINLDSENILTGIFWKQIYSNIIYVLQ